MSKADYLLCFYVPVENASFVKEAVFRTGAGAIGDYESCAFESSGEGQVRPINKADPTIGRVGELSKVKELKVELVCTKDNVRAAVSALKSAHPYEEPAYHVLKIASDF